VEILTEEKPQICKMAAVSAAKMWIAKRVGVETRPYATKHTQNKEEIYITKEIAKHQQ